MIVVQGTTPPWPISNGRAGWRSSGPPTLACSGLVCMPSPTDATRRQPSPRPAPSHGSITSRTDRTLGTTRGSKESDRCDREEFAPRRRPPGVGRLLAIGRLPGVRTGSSGTPAMAGPGGANASTGQVRRHLTATPEGPCRDGDALALRPRHRLRLCSAPGSPRRPRLTTPAGRRDALRAGSMGRPAAGPYGIPRSRDGAGIGTGVAGGSPTASMTPPGSTLPRPPRGRYRGRRAREEAIGHEAVLLVPLARGIRLRRSSARTFIAIRPPAAPICRARGPGRRRA